MVPASAVPGLSKSTGFAAARAATAPQPQDSKLPQVYLFRFFESYIMFFWQSMVLPAEACQQQPAPCCPRHTSWA